MASEKAIVYRCLGLSVVIYVVAAGLIIRSWTTPHGWGGGAGVPGALLQPLVLLIASGFVAIAGLIVAVTSIIAVANRNEALGGAVISISVLALAAALAQLAFLVYGPDI